MSEKIKKATRHTSQNEGLIFEKSSPGKRAFELPPLDVPAVDAAKALGDAHRRDGVDGFPEVSEIEVIRHFTRLSTWNFAIDLGMYPLGSCTMKYNPRVNEFVAQAERACNRTSLPASRAFAGLPANSATAGKVPAGNYRDGRDHAATRGRRAGRTDRTAADSRAPHEERQPAQEGADTGLRARHEPATAVIAGYEVENIKSNADGQVDLEKLREQVTPDVAALMLTNPSTLGIFEQQIPQIAEILHAKGALLYMDGANMNALTGVTRPGELGVDVMHLNLHKTFSTPHGGGGPGAGPVAMKKILEPYLPVPVLVEKEGGRLALDFQRKETIGRVKAFVGNFGVLVRALAYILAYGPGVRQATEDAVMNANYIRKGLEGVFDLPYTKPSMHEVVFSDAIQKKNGVGTMDIAKRLIDYGFHPYTTAFPLIVPGALMIEPTESESIEELDLFVEAMKSIAKESAETPELVKTAPHTTRVRRLDEVGAARKPVLRWKAGHKQSEAAD